uniref:Endoplasmic reticulum-Golgi intermediate compartment protein n=1 Tax=Ailuropoda melanoleuca TaxID=9646 RepID=A0A7N5JNW3_AILME
MGCAERHFPAAGGERRVSGAVGGRRGRGGRRRLAAGWDPRGAAAYLACSASTPGGGGTMPFDFRSLYLLLPLHPLPLPLGAHRIHNDGSVPGNFHVSTHSATAQPQNPDMTHVIHKLSFGDTLQVQNVHGAFNALGGADRLTSNPLASHDYILKIVPTVYEDKSGKQRYSYQYTVANKEYVAYSHTGRIIPAIWFRYDLSPITVKYTERRQPLYRFITTICAIIGGTFTVAGILDSCIFTASEAWKKIQLGKMH